MKTSEIAYCYFTERKAHIYQPSSPPSLLAGRLISFWEIPSAKIVPPED